MRRVRWWPAVLIVLLSGLWLGRVWLVGETTRQHRVVRTMGGANVVALALLVWFAAFSRLARRSRLLGVASVVVAAGLFAALFRSSGVTGDLVPILSLRWAPERSLPQPPPPAPAAIARAAPMEPVPPPVEPSSEVRRPAAALSTTPARPAGTAAGPGGDFPQFLGPTRDGTIRGLRLAREWSTQPPRPVWRQPIGAGWSGFAVAGDTAVTQEQRGEEEVVVSYDVSTGAVRWMHADRARHQTFNGGVGPRATPTVHTGRVFTMGATGILNALDLRTGARLWTKDVLVDNGARSPEWGKSCSPLVLGGRVIVSAGGASGRSLVAYDAATGDRAWASGDDLSAYGSPLIATLEGTLQVLIFNASSLAAHDPETGALLWQHTWAPTQPNVSQPVVLPGDRVLLSAGYGMGSKLFQVARSRDGSLAASVVWERPRPKAKFTNFVHHSGFVYGLDDGVLVCLDPATGELRWKSGRYGHGQVLLVQDLLLVQTEEGEIVLVEPRPDAHLELTRFTALDGRTWNPPALAGPRLVVRNDREAACYELPLR